MAIEISKLEKYKLNSCFWVVIEENMLGIFCSCDVGLNSMFFLS